MAQESRPRLGIRAYARHRSNRFGPVSHAAVRKAIESGRIAAAYDGGTLDVAMADALWDANTDPAQQRGQHAPRAGADDRQRGLFAGPETGTAPGENGNGDGGMSYRKATMLRELFRAQLLELELRERRGDLVAAAVVRREQFELARRVRDRLNVIPDRLPGLPDAAREALRRELQEALEELAVGFRT